MESTLSLPKLHSLTTLTPNTHTTLFTPKPHNLRYTKTKTFIRAAISRTKKEETIEVLKKNLENCYLLAAISYKGMTAKQLNEFRKSLPENTKLIVAKNTLVGKAVENTKFEAIKPAMNGMNAWLFVQMEEIPVGLKPYREFQKAQKLEEKNDYGGACFEGKYYAPEDFKILETMPSKAELFSKILGTLKAPGSTLVGTIQAPARDLVMTLKAYVKKLEDEQGGGGAAAGDA